MPLLQAMLAKTSSTDLPPLLSQMMKLLAF